MLLTDDEETIPEETVRTHLSAVPWGTFLTALLINSVVLTSRADTFRLIFRVSPVSTLPGPTS